MRLTMKPATSFASSGSSTALVPTRLAITPPRSMSPITTTGTSAARAKPILAMSFLRRLISDALPAPSTRTMSASCFSLAKLSSTYGISFGFRSCISRAVARPNTLPCTITCAPTSLCGLSSTGFICTDGSTQAASACSACARPISPPSAVTAALFDMFCGLNGLTLSPRFTSARASPATSSDLPTLDPVPCSMRTRAAISTRCRLAPSPLRRSDASPASSR